MISLNKNNVVEVTCRYCKNEYQILADIDDIARWMTGEGLIQDILHYLKPDERELLISQTCGSCWDYFFEASENLEDLEEE